LYKPDDNVIHALKPWPHIDEKVRAVKHKGNQNQFY
jgi:hypothetical protein